MECGKSSCGEMNEGSTIHATRFHHELRGMAITPFRSFRD
jgi:hypothetical protein